MILCSWYRYQTISNADVMPKQARKRKPKCRTRRMKLSLCQNIALSEVRRIFATRAWDPVDARTFSPPDDVHSRRLSDFVVRKAYCGQRSQKESTNAHQVIEAKNAHILRNSYAKGEQMLVSYKGCCRVDSILENRRLAGLNHASKTLAEHADRTEFHRSRKLVAAGWAGALGLRAHGA
jgi:hypothetical protein